jgi:hypothetical protein
MINRLSVFLCASFLATLPFSFPQTSRLKDASFGEIQEPGTERNSKVVLAEMRASVLEPFRGMLPGAVCFDTYVQMSDGQPALKERIKNALDVCGLDLGWQKEYSLGRPTVLFLVVKIGQIDHQLVNGEFTGMSSVSIIFRVDQQGEFDRTNNYEVVGPGELWESKSHHCQATLYLDNNMLVVNSNGLDGKVVGAVRNMIDQLKIDVHSQQKKPSRTTLSDEATALLVQEMKEDGSSESE